MPLFILFVPNPALQFLCLALGRSKKGLIIQDFTIKNAMPRLKEQGDIFKPVLGKGINIEKTIKALQKNAS